jgi:hypothetical protein
MLKKITTAVALSATLFAATTLPALAHEGEVHCEDTVLSGIMKEMNDDLKAYVAAFKRNDPTAMQAQVTKLLANTAKAKNEIPVKLKQKQNDMPIMDHDMSAMDENMPAMNHDMPAMEQNMPTMDHSQMANMPGMDHQTHMQHQGYQQGIEKLTHLFKQLKTANTKTEVKTVLNTIKQHTKKSHREYQLDCE